MLLERQKVKLQDWPAAIAQVRDLVKKRWTQHRLFWGGLLALIIAIDLACLSLRTDQAATFIAFSGVGLLLLGLLVYGPRARNARRTLLKAQFLEELVSELADDLLPGSYIRFTFDLRAYYDPAKPRTNWRAPAGKSKRCYYDNWLHFEATLADGTEFRVVRRRSYKEKAGNLQKEVRRMMLTVRPVVGRYPFASTQLHADRLRKALSQEAPRLFHNTPELFDLRVAGSDRGFCLKVVQEDAEILAVEVQALLASVLRIIAHDRPYR